MIFFTRTITIVFALILMWGCFSQRYSPSTSAANRKNTPNQANLFFEKNPDGIIRPFRVNDTLVQIHFSIHQKKVRNFSDSIPYEIIFFSEQGHHHTLYEDKLMLKAIGGNVCGYFQIPFSKIAAPGKYNLKIYQSQNAHGFLIQEYLEAENQPLYNFILTDSNGLILPSHYFPPEKPIHVRIRKQHTFVIEVNSRESGFPPPVFFEGPAQDVALWQKISTLSKDTILKISPKKSLRITDLKGNILGGVYVSGDVFPGIGDGKEMTEATRYIMNKEEYERCINSPDPKKEIELFWKEIGGSKERARELIRQYYNRVVEANEHFTEFPGPGFKSDRGMVYIVFGKPDHVYYYDDGEIWHFGSNEEKSALNFKFKRLNGTLTLERSVTYKDYWYQMVDYWRQGKIRVFGK
ncbi:MAG: GWxTD domain-containing protein [Bacteroidia bacterium]|nr:GWxTD domain-containing protein [Bacteroidia bacterium]